MSIFLGGGEFVKCLQIWVRITVPVWAPRGGLKNEPETERKKPGNERQRTVCAPMMHDDETVCGHPQVWLRLEIAGLCTEGI